MEMEQASKERRALASVQRRLASTCLVYNEPEFPIEVDVLPCH